jgi:hypothetical protein
MMNVVSVLFGISVFFSVFFIFILWSNKRRRFLGKPTFGMGEYYTESSKESVCAGLAGCLVVAILCALKLFI